MLLGGVIAVIGAFGLIRLPDFYTRLHAQTVATVGGAVLILIGLLAQPQHPSYSTKIALVIIFTILTNPTASHAIARSALKMGIKPWRGK